MKSVYLFLPMATRYTKGHQKSFLCQFKVGHTKSLLQRMCNNQKPNSKLTAIIPHITETAHSTLNRREKMPPNVT